ncbi:MAG: acetate--CoA ligase family protein, partial [Candidatus Thermoplasmatota archaeon]|nr:acetate--CoA ligase family protein [Candidatus Thermoplasmatota archaeon]
GIHAADAGKSYGMEVPELSPDVQESLRKFLPAEAAVRNPVDMTANDVPGGYLNAIKTVAGGNMVDAIYVIYVPAISVDPGRVAREINEAASSLKGKITIVANFMASRGLANELSEPYDSQPAETVRIPSYPFPEDGIKALSLAASYGEWLSLPDEPPAVFTDIRREEAAYILSGDDAAENDGWLSQDSVRKILECYGIAQAGSALCNSPEEAGNEAGRMGVKVVLKGIAHGLVHKTEAGAVVVGLEGRQNVAESARNMLKRLQDAGYSGVKFLVQEQIENAVEMFIGVTNDGNFGPVIACGAGGIMVELIRDVAVSLTPLSRHDAEKMLKSLKTYRLLSGFRGGPTYDTDSLTEMILRLGNLVEDFQSISELDFNPVMVKQKGGGAFVVDARIRITPRREMPYVGIR